MKPFALLVVGVVVGWAASGSDWSPKTVGQEADPSSDKPINSINVGTPRRLFENRMEFDSNGQPHPATTSRLVNADGSVAPELTPGLVGRFQATAYGSPSGHGCYIVDTMSGTTWHATNGQPAKVVARSLSLQTTLTTPPVETLVPTPAYTTQAPPLFQQNSVVTPKPEVAQPMLENEALDSEPSTYSTPAPTPARNPEPSDAAN